MSPLTQLHTSRTMQDGSCQGCVILHVQLLKMLYLCKLLSKQHRFELGQGTCCTIWDGIKKGYHFIYLEGNCCAAFVVQSKKEYKY